MADGYPQFGGTNGVPVLDFGQVGGARQQGGTALFSGNVIEGPDEVRTVKHVSAQANKVYEDVLGAAGKRVTIRGVIRASSAVVMRMILEDINHFRHGSGRDEQGNLTAPNPAYIKPTKLTDAAGGVISARARLADWRPTDRRHTGTEWAAIQPIEMGFDCLA